MKVICTGGGPAGLYLSILLKRVGSEAHEVTVVERDPADSTYGWGVVFWDDLLEALRHHDPESEKAIAEAAVRWERQVLALPDGVRVTTPGHGYAMRRQRLLELLRARATQLGVELRFAEEVAPNADLSDFDLVAVAEGVGSGRRSLNAASFGPRIAHGSNQYIWLGCTKVFGSFSFIFARSDAGWIWAHAYGIDEQMSTFIVECTRQTWERLGLSDATGDETVKVLEELFAEYLDGHRLIVAERDAVRSPWRSFLTLTNDRWSAGEQVLLGDAAHTTHFTIGSGTRLAIEDAIALAQALGESAPRSEILTRYEMSRKNALRQLQTDAKFSARWFEDVSRYITLPPEAMFALMQARRSPLIPSLPPMLYYRLHQFSEALAPLRAVRTLIGQGTRLRHNRRPAQ